MELHLYDTYTRSLRKFEPLEAGKVGMYTCGPTVYDYAHLGNLRTYVFEDILRRVLEFNSYQVEHVMNITDVGHLVSDADEGEDKMEKGSRRTGLSAYQIAEKYTAAFQEDITRLNILFPTVWCKATEHIQEQIDFIACIEARGYTYRTSDGIYFDTSKLPNYGYLARLDIEGLQAGARIEMGEKRNPTDFALWKFSPAGQKRQMEWDSPWGVGFPGWHIECSAMSARYLGSFFDIHCGGEDHISVHHTNEIAQTEACYGTRLANFWLHGYFLQVDAERMSKSSGEFLRLQSVLDRGIDPLAYRLFCLNAHYRSKLNFSWEGLESAATSLQRLRTAYYEWGQSSAGRQERIDEQMLGRFRDQVNDDLNMPRALAVVWELVRSDLPPEIKKGTLSTMDRVLGLRLAEWRPEEETAPLEILTLLEARQQARKEKRWADADALRQQIQEAGYEIEDTPQGSRVKRKRTTVGEG
jgi:cysteinyl-tRNA synthetase